ncbi:MAG: hypothetical protein CL577_05570 [Alteromonadaceae bacterium]|jgi:hypothetical protein|uniref:hypothetical protein n=1 Tax=Rheinheimera TaxID=67575 RepID=UPI000C5DF002|nr:MULTISPECIES: hypothetical protein [Rheinheimera]MBJ92059.1 hypothetical protein [Alteromonadaceae bacterium]MCD1598456.1 hypothetical protein [Rheinheimera aquimaris]HBN89576.1 hypothetical protein [Rheinheimera sp.]|tara:strand:+ start:2416 stop:2826 length:411 start_codon:yes stop_codon:yes gene_type:complete
MQAVSDFFQQYAQAYISRDLQRFGQLISLPSMLLAGDNKTLLTDIESLQGYVLSRVEKYRELGVENADFVLQHQLRLSEQLQFVSLYWRFYDSNSKVLFTCHTSYTLQRCETQWQVVAIILDDEDAAYQRLRNQVL